MSERYPDRGGSGVSRSHKLIVGGALVLFVSGLLCIALGLATRGGYPYVGLGISLVSLAVVAVLLRECARSIRGWLNARKPR